MTDQKKQIEEMERDLIDSVEHETLFDVDFYTTSKNLIAKGYRKETQGEWKVRGLPRPRSCPIIHAITCSNCGFDIEMLQGKRYKYCPNCGAKMRGE